MNDRPWPGRLDAPALDGITQSLNLSRNKKEEKQTNKQKAIA